MDFNCFDVVIVHSFEEGEWNWCSIEKEEEKKKEDRFLVSIPVGNWKKVENTQVYSRGNNLGGTKVCVFQLREVFVFSLTEDLEGGTLADNVCESWPRTRDTRRVVGSLNQPGCLPAIFNRLRNPLRTFFPKTFVIDAKWQIFRDLRFLFIYLFTFSFFLLRKGSPFHLTNFYNFYNHRRVINISYNLRKSFKSFVTNYISRGKTRYNISRKNVGIDSAVCRYVSRDSKLFDKRHKFLCHNGRHSPTFQQAWYTHIYIRNYNYEGVSGARSRRRYASVGESVQGRSIESPVVIPTCS